MTTSFEDNAAQSLEGKVAIVTGASRGIGAAVARAMAQAGAAVTVAARDTVALDLVAEDIIAQGGRALAVPTDVSDPGAVAQLTDTTLTHFGRLDFACNNAAGGGHPPTPLADVSPEGFASAVAVNLNGVFLGMRHQIPAMIATGGGSIVNMSSTAGLQAVGGLAAYVATKFGIEGLTRVAALDYADQGVRVNAIAPGPILTDNLARAGAEAQRAAAAAMPLQRIGRPEEVAEAVVWLCSDAAAFVTGTTLVIDGGKLAGAPPFMIRRPAAGSA
jgi:NAD(P)-dependent dehydrogenase (short-subunit alcohol dehydrogenase family)